MFYAVIVDCARKYHVETKVARLMLSKPGVLASSRVMELLLMFWWWWWWQSE
jgi:hypothetical protein